MSPHVGSVVSTSTKLSSHRIVYGFSIDCISSSIHSKTQLSNPTPILKPEATSKEPAKKTAVFTLSGSSDEDDNSSFETQNRSSESDEAIGTDSESEGGDSDDNAIEDDDYEDDEDQWEDDNASGPSSFNDRELFQRVDSRPNLTSHRSLLTTLLHEGDRAQALQNAASRSTPAMSRSRTSLPNGSSLATSPQEDNGLMMRSTQIPRSKPIIMTTSSTHPPALSPRTTRRNMLQTELTESLRRHLLWEHATSNAVLKRHQSAIAANPALRRAMTTDDIKSMNVFQREGTGKPPAYRDMAMNNSYNEYFDQGLQEYHQKGW